VLVNSDKIHTPKDWISQQPLLVITQQSVDAKLFTQVSFHVSWQATYTLRTVQYIWLSKNIYTLCRLLSWYTLRTAAPCSYTHLALLQSTRTCRANSFPGGGLRLISSSLFLPFIQQRKRRARHYAMRWLPRWTSNLDLPFTKEGGNDSPRHPCLLVSLADCPAISGYQYHYYSGSC
jgi:hypothetical protein